IGSVVSGPAPARQIRPQVATQPISPIPTRAPPRKLPQVEEHLHVPTNRPLPRESSSQPPRFAQTTPTSVLSPTPSEQFRVFVDQSRNLTAAPQSVSSNSVSE